MVPRFLLFNGAGGRIRTADPRITNALLYHLSYTGIGCEAAYYKWNFDQREPPARRIRNVRVGT